MNDFLLGRYRRTGPQGTLFVPAAATRSGANTLTILELDHLTDPSARLVPTARLGPREE